MSAVGLLAGTDRLIVGVEDDILDPTLVRVYIDHRAYWRYVLVSDPESKRKVKAAWNGGGYHLTMPKPEGYYTDERFVLCQWMADPTRFGRSPK